MVPRSREDTPTHRIAQRAGPISVPQNGERAPEEDPPGPAATSADRTAPGVDE
jgi:hypothetical protein